MEKIKESVGILIIAKNTNNFMLLHRVKQPLVWSTLTGKMDIEGETPLEAIKREIKEEINLDPSEVSGIREVGSVEGGHRLFHIFIGFVDEEFTPNLKMDENDGFGWFNETNLPTPIHKKWQETFQIVKPVLNLRKEYFKHTKNLV